MALHIFINGKQCGNPIVKYGLAVAVLLGASAVSALVLFVFLPAIGISIAITLGLIIVLGAGIFAAAVAMVLGSAILSIILALVEKLAVRIERKNRN